MLKKPIFKKAKNNDFVGLESQIVYFITTLVIVCCVLLGLVTSYLSYQSSIGAINKTIKETSDVAADLVEVSTREYLAIAYETGCIARLASADKTIEEKKSIIQQRIDKNGFLDGTIIDKNGMDLFNQVDVSDSDYFKECIQGKTYVQTPSYSEVEKQVCMVVAAPLWEGGIPDTTVVGVIVFVPDGEYLNNIMRQIVVGKNGTAFMVDSTGTTIADIDSTIVGVENGIELGKTNTKLKKFGKIVEKMAAGENGIGTYRYNGVIKIVAYSPVENSNGWSIAVVAVRNNFLGKFYISLLISLILVIAFIIFGNYAGKIYGKKIAQPIIQCVERLKLLAQGDLTSEIPQATSNDETQILLLSLKSTVDSLNHIIQDIGIQLNEMSNGNFKIDINETYIGDFATISKSFRKIVTALSSAMIEIDGNAQRVALGASDVAKASQGLAEGATDQASAIEELTATITEISNRTQDNAKHTEEAKELVDNMNAEISQSNNQMQQSIDGMGKIKEASSEIANIIKSIEDIATQTNLLSLNAAIEAARAGESGRGFAVVAQQVRALAEQSAMAAKNTAVLIQNSIQAVEEGTKLNQIAANSMDEVIGKAKQVDHIVTEIAAASSSQANAVSQITEGINQIASVVESNSATAQESAAASEELSGESAMLKNLIDKFQF
ncbi:methyl-accepting chemotaxis protein [Lachnotalea glycerini]|uniref:Methyl-accepting chemotaxis protein n=1 Tax=Lachnotalea glycerini TaxID=1763509 RepID=A0A371JEV7_9FIRM|nr:methyl-accepting chemotaxis protein [Lachnotalea glycerini]RDY31272.1 methyl-accepting chemotaxis protein [Lachnotalea glycerini]